MVSDYLLQFAQFLGIGCFQAYPELIVVHLKKAGSGIEEYFPSLAIKLHLEFVPPMLAKARQATNWGI
jgi:hypothetical protein